MSLLDKYAEYMENKASPANDVVRRIWDPNYLTPDVFYVMDEIKRHQILRRFDKSEGEPGYAGTFQILFKTEDLDKFCLIMRRLPNERPVLERYAESYEREKDLYIIASYYPGTHSRIYLRGLGAPAMTRVVEKYERKMRKKLPIPREGAVTIR